MLELFVVVGWLSVLIGAAVLETRRLVTMNQVLRATVTLALFGVVGAAVAGLNAFFGMMVIALGALAVAAALASIAVESHRSIQSEPEEKPAA
jgi:hypothetical protein